MNLTTLEELELPPRHDVAVSSEEGSSNYIYATVATTLSSEYTLMSLLIIYCGKEHERSAKGAFDLQALDIHDDATIVRLSHNHGEQSGH